MENSLVPRDGPTHSDYFVDFVQFLYERTGFCLDYTTEKFQKTLRNLEKDKIPMKIWHAIRNGAMRLMANNLITELLTVENFVFILMIVIDVVVSYCLQYVLIKTTFYVLVYVSRPILKFIIVTLYRVLDWLGQNLWEVVRPRIEAYCNLAINKTLPFAVKYSMLKQKEDQMIKYTN